MTAPAVPAKPEATPAPAPSPSPAPAPSPTSPPAPAPAPSPFAGLSDAEKDKMLTFYMGAAKAQEGRLNELATQVADLRKPAEPVKPNIVQENKDFYDNPVTTLRREIDAAIAPLRDFVSKVGTQTEYDKIKMELRTDPRLKEIFDRGEVHIDGLINKANAGGKTVTKDQVLAAVASVKGAMELGWLDGGPAPTPAPVPAAPPAPAGGPVIPPHLRPSSPPAPAPGAPAKGRDLTEEERRLARESKMSDEEYLLALNMPADQVVNPKAWEVKKP